MNRNINNTIKVTMLIILTIVLALFICVYIYAVMNYSWRIIPGFVIVLILVNLYNFKFYKNEKHMVRLFVYVLTSTILLGGVFIVLSKIQLKIFNVPIPWRISYIVMIITGGLIVGVEKIGDRIFPMKKQCNEDEKHHKQEKDDGAADV